MALATVIATTLQAGQRLAQVTSLALCKHNKNDLLLHKLRRRVRHGRARSLFWRYNEVPKEVLKVLQVGPPKHSSTLSLSWTRRYDQQCLDHDR